MSLTTLIRVDEYHAMIDSGEVDPHVELLEGALVPKLPRGPRHRAVTWASYHTISPVLPSGWSVLTQAPVTTRDSEPEPDLAIFRGGLGDYLYRHPGPGDVALAIEVSYSSLHKDRGLKSRVYANAGIPQYWIVNLAVDSVEARSEPVQGEYTVVETYRPGQSIPLVLDGVEVARIPVDTLLPR